MSIRLARMKMRSLFILLGVFLSSGAFWSAIAIVIARRVFHIEEEAELLRIAAVVVVVCLVLCIFVLPKKLRMQG
jgi:hypothetical protein